MTLSLPLLRQLLEAGTARPWTVDLDSRGDLDEDQMPTVHRIEGAPHMEDYGSGPEEYRDRVVETDGGHYEPKFHDASLIVAAVNALPQLLAIAEAACAWRDACLHGTGSRAMALCDLEVAIDSARKEGM
jgi:hypothetical protein